jgi:DNA-binding response OmpR family regulator
MLKVMIAEDDLLIADMLEEVLVANGYDVCGIARTVDHAVALGAQYRPDLAILDLQLADGGFGTEVAARLDRQNRPGILYATGRGARTVLMKASGEACLDKPYWSEDVVHALRIVEQMVTTGTAPRPFPKGFRLLRA